MIFDFSNGAAAEQLHRLTKQVIEAISTYSMPDLGTICFDQIDPDGERFIYSKGEERYLMFAYLPRYNTKTHNQLPRFHTGLCEVRQTYSGYVFSPKMPVDILSKDEGRLLESQYLSMCKRCRGQVTRSLFGARGELPWYEYVLQEAAKKRTIKSDGYVDLWRQISEAVREKSNWRCRQCQIQLNKPYQRYYLEVHHRDGDKQNNAESNLLALCIACHAEQDEWHRANYSEGPNRLKLDQYLAIREVQDKG